MRYVPTLPGEELVDDVPGGAKAVIDGTPRADFSAPERSGIYKFAVELNKATKAVDGVSIVTLVPSSEKRSGRIGAYQLGSWPFEAGGAPKSDRYAPPEGSSK